MLTRQLIQLLLIQHIFVTARLWKCRKMSTRKPAPQRLSIYAKGFSRIIDCISLHILDEYLTRTKGNIFFALFEGMSLRKGPADWVWGHSLSGTSIRRKCHESVMSLVMGSGL